MDPTLIILLCLVGVAIALVIWGMINYLVQDSNFQKHGLLVEGRIVAHRETVNLWSKGFPERYYLTYRYEYQRTSYTHEQQVSKETYLYYSDGERIRVRCLPDNPTRAQVLDF